MPGDWHLPVPNLKILALCTQHMVSERQHGRRGWMWGSDFSPHVAAVLLCAPFSPDLLYLFCAPVKWGKRILPPIKALAIFY